MPLTCIGSRPLKAFSGPFRKGSNLSWNLHKRDNGDSSFLLVYASSPPKLCWWSVHPPSVSSLFDVLPARASWAWSNCLMYSSRLTHFVATEWGVPSVHLLCLGIQSPSLFGFLHGIPLLASGGAALFVSQPPRASLPPKVSILLLLAIPLITAALRPTAFLCSQQL